jgi:hypothetical protein
LPIHVKISHQKRHQKEEKVVIQKIGDSRWAMAKVKLSQKKQRKSKISRKVFMAVTISIKTINFMSKSHIKKDTKKRKNCHRKN